jgi:hypothetical protein
MVLGPTATVGVSATVSGGGEQEWRGAGSFAAVDGVRRRGPVWGQAGPDLGQAGPDPGQEGLGGASADVPATLGCRSSASALLLDSSVREGRGSVLLSCCGEPLDAAQDGLDRQWAASATAWPVPGRCGCGAPSWRFAVLAGG